MEKCPNCKAQLNIDEKSSGKCFSCGASFEVSLPKKSRRFNYDNFDNTVARVLKICGFVIIIAGTIFSFMIAGGDDYRYDFSYIKFLPSELISIMSGLFFIGFSEIIQLLEDIKNKLR